MSKKRVGWAESRLWGSPIFHSYPSPAPPGATLLHCAQHGFAQRNGNADAMRVATVQRWRNVSATGAVFQEERTHAHEQTFDKIRGRADAGTR